MNQKIAPIHYDMIKDMRDEGMKHKEIAEHFDVRKETIGYILSKVDGPKKKYIRKEMPDEDELYVKYIEENQTIKQLMEHYGVSRSILQRWLRKAELSKRLDVPDNIEELYITENFSQSELAKHYDVDLSRIRSWLIQSGIRKNKTIKRGATK